MENTAKTIELCGKCKKCCCPQDISIRLTPRDVFCIAYEKKLSISDVLLKYCDVIKTGIFPEIYLKKEMNTCIFEKQECSLQRKPDMCASFPCGGTLWFNEKYENVIFECNAKQSLSSEQAERIIGDLLFEKYKSGYSEDAYFQKWRQVLSVCSMLVAGMEKESERLEAEEQIIFYLYQKYVTDKFFLPQFEKNVLELVSILS